MQLCVRFVSRLPQVLLEPPDDCLITIPGVCLITLLQDETAGIANGLYVCLSVYYCRTYKKAVSGAGERGKGGHVLMVTTSRGLCVRVRPPHTIERRGRGGGCEQGGWRGGEGRARRSGQEERQRHILDVEMVPRCV